MYWQLDWIYFIQHFRSPVLDHWFFFWNFFDRQELYFIVIPFLWLGIHWKWGVRFFYLLSFSSLVNFLLKMIFMTPRPFILDPSVALIAVPDPGFPSGGAQTAALLGGLLIWEWRKSFWGWFIGLNFFFWLSLSRLYLGVHFPMDLLGGWLVGILLLRAFYKFDPLIEKWGKKQSWTFIFVTLTIVSLLLPLLFPFGRTLVFAGASEGVILALFLSSRFHLLVDPQSLKEGIFRSLFGIVGIFLLVFLLHPQFHGISRMIFLESMVFGLWMGFLAPLLWKKSFGVLFKKKAT